jgi:hypothetical protein
MNTYDENYLWRKASFSDANQNCVQLADTGSTILIRDSKHPDQGQLTFTRNELAAFLAGAKAGEFDDMA